jgi:hypothetical protein
MEERVVETPNTVNDCVPKSVLSYETLDKVDAGLDRIYDIQKDNFFSMYKIQHQLNIFYQFKLAEDN